MVADLDEIGTSSVTGTAATNVTTFSREQAARLDADLTVVIGGDELRTDPMLTGIPSAKAGRPAGHRRRGRGQRVATSTVLSVPYTLERLVPLMKRALGL
jgi:iron complex transport system substrate-binding protein